MSELLQVIATGRGQIKPGIRGTILDGGERTVYLGPVGKEVETKIPEFKVRYGGNGSLREFEQYGRDFVFVTSAEGKELVAKYPEYEIKEAPPKPARKRK